MINLIINTLNANIMVTVGKKPFSTKLNQMPLGKTAHFMSMARNTPGEPGHLATPDSKEAFKDH